MKVTGSIASLAGGFAMVAADRAVEDKAGVIASHDVTFGRSFSTEPTLGFKPATLTA